MSTTQARGIKIALAVTVAVGVLAVAAVAGVKAYTWAYGPLLDEWVCSPGEAPADLGRGSACFDEDADLPPGYEWDPLGNRPFSCDHRRGWTQVQHERTSEVDCLEEGRTPPDGWVVIGDS